MSEMLPPELMAAMQGGGGAPPPGPQGGQLPPELLAMLQQPDGGGVPQGPPQPEQAPPGGALHAGGVAEGDPVAFYQQGLDALEQGAKSDNDEQRINVVMKAMTAIQGLLASGQKAQDAGIGGQMDPAAMRQGMAADTAY